MSLELNGTTGVSLVQDGVVTADDLASGAITSGALPAGSVLQVVSTTKTDATTLNGDGSWDDISGLSLNITPSSTSSKILITLTTTYGGGSNLYGNIRLHDGAAICIGNASGDRQQSTSTMASNDQTRPRFTGATFLASPATTSQKTYKVQFKGQSSQSVKINTSSEDENSSITGVRATSTLTLMEIAG